MIFPPMFGHPIKTSDLLTKSVEDWSRVRSPGRARRRRRLGFRQNITMRTVADPTIYKIEGVLVMHPDIFALLKAKAQGGAS